MTSIVQGTPLWREPDYWLGVREMAMVSVGVAAWGLVTGMAMVKAGLGVPMAVLMSLVVYAGSAQLASLPLLSIGAPIWLILGTALCVNLRFVIFSAQWRPYFRHLGRLQRLWHGYFTTDMGYVLFMKRHKGLPPEGGSPRGPMAYFWGGALMNWFSWHAASLAGIFLADAIPAHWGIGFAGTLALLALSCSLITDRITVLTAVVAAMAAVAAYAMPMRLNIVVAIAAAVALGVVMDQVKGRTDGRGGAGR